MNSRVRHLDRLSFVYEMMGHTRQALEALTRLPKAEQTKPETIRRQAVLAQKLGDRRAMLAHLRELAAAEPSASSLAALADAQIGANERPTLRRQPSKNFWQSTAYRLQQELATSNAWAISRFRAAIRSERSLLS